jgi:putative transposase
MVCLKFFNTDQGSIPVRFTPMYSKQWNKNFYGRGTTIDNILLKDYGTVKYENVYLQAYTDGISLYRGLKIILL